MEVGPPVLMLSILIANPVVKCRMLFGKLWPGSIRNMLAKVPVRTVRVRAKVRVRTPGRLRTSSRSVEVNMVAKVIGVPVVPKVVVKETGTKVERATKGEKVTKDGRRMAGDYLGTLL